MFEMVSKSRTIINNSKNKNNYILLLIVSLFEFIFIKHK